MHELFEKAIENSDFSLAYLSKSLDQLIQGKIERLYSVNETDSNCKKKLDLMLSNISDWGKFFFQPNPTSQVIIKKKLIVSLINFFFFNK